MRPQKATRVFKTNQNARREALLTGEISICRPKKQRPRAMDDSTARTRAAYFARARGFGAGVATGPAFGAGLAGGAGVAFASGTSAGSVAVGPAGTGAGAAGVPAGAGSGGSSGTSTFSPTSVASSKYITPLISPGSGGEVQLQLIFR